MNKSLFVDAAQSHSARVGREASASRSDEKTNNDAILRIFLRAAQRTRASPARPATRNGSALAMRLPSGPRPVQALVGPRQAVSRRTANDRLGDGRNDRSQSGWNRDQRDEHEDVTRISRATLKPMHETTDRNHDEWEE